MGTRWALELEGEPGWRQTAACMPADRVSLLWDWSVNLDLFQLLHAGIAGDLTPLPAALCHRQRARHAISKSTGTGALVYRQSW